MRNGTPNSARDKSKIPPSFFILAEDGILTQRNMINDTRINNWANLVNGKIHHYVLSRDKQNIYIVFGNDFIYLKKFSIKTQKMLKSYGKFMNAQVSYNLRLTYDESYLFILGDEERILIQLDLKEGLYKLWCRDVIHFELSKCR